MTQGSVLVQGAAVDGRYRLDARLGDGSFGEVWRASDLKFAGRVIAIKFLKPEYLTNGPIVARFQNEATALGLLQHPNIVSVVDRGQWGAQQYIAMEYVEGLSLGQWLDEHRRGQRLPQVSQVQIIFDQICAGVGAAHSLRAPGAIIHRDIKPANVILRVTSGECLVKVLDFGIAQLGARGGTQTGAMMGTLAYMAPEQALGQTTVIGPPTDVFALGVLLVEMLSLHAVLGPEQTFWGMALQREASIPSLLSGMRPDVPLTVQAEVVRALRCASTERHADATALRDALRRAWMGTVNTQHHIHSQPAIARTAQMDMSALSQGNTPVPPLANPHSASAPPQTALWNAPTGIALAPGYQPPWPNGQPPPSWPNAPPPRPPTVNSNANKGIIAAVIGGLVLFLGAVSAAALWPSEPRRPDPPRVQGCAAGDAQACLREGDGFLNATGAGRSEARAAESFQRACNGAVLDGCVRLGELYERGGGVARDYPHAAALYTQACDGGRPLGCTRLAKLHRDGTGVLRNDARAASLLVRACDAGDLQGCNDLGDMYVIGRSVPADIPRATRLYQQSCGGGNMEGCDSLGMLFRDATGVPRDEARAAQLFQQSCNGGLMEGCSDLGSMYASGRGVPRDDGRAVQLFQQSCTGSFLQGCVTLGQMYADGQGVPRDDAHAAALYRQACDADWWEGCNALGFMHDNGRGVARDQSRAAALYQQACNGEWWSGCENLGWLYHRGQGVPQDDGHAVQLFQRACDNNFVDSCNSLGQLYEAGNGVVRDPARASALYQQACRGGAGAGCNNVGWMYANGHGVARDEAVAARFYVAGCERGDTYCNNLGSAYENARGVPRDYARAATLYDRACRAGNMSGCNNLGVLLDTGRGVAADPRRAASLYDRACASGDRVACDNRRRLRERTGT